VKKQAKVNISSIFDSKSLPKDRIEQDKKKVDLLLKKKMLGIDHRNFRFLDQQQQGKTNETSQVFQAIKVKKIKEGSKIILILFYNVDSY